jgi:TRAP-type C4-dicarboxylate transport system permease small subunit
MHFFSFTRPIYRWIRYVCNAFLVLQVLLVCYIVFTRFALNDSPAWGEELALLFMVWFCLLSPPEALHENRHLAISLSQKFLPGPVIRIIDAVNHVLILVFAAFMVIEGAKLTQLTGRNILPGLGMSASILYVSVPIAGVLLAIASIDRIIEILSIPGREYLKRGCKE